MLRQTLISVAAAVVLVAGAAACRGAPPPGSETTPRGAEADLPPCYPYRMRAGECLVACDTDEDCADHARPGDPRSRGWPLDCQRGECVPVPPAELE